MASIQKALNHRVDEVEIDVRITGDGVLILHHDTHLQHPSGERLAIAETDHAALKRHKPDLATLDEAIKIVARTVPLQIEVKKNTPTAPIIDIVKQHIAAGWLPTDFVLSSKHQPTLVELHRALPSIPIVVVEAWSGFRAAYRARQVGSKRISMNQLSLWSGFIRSMQSHGYEVYAYTLNDSVKAKKWAKHGLAGVVTDLPDSYENNH